AYDNLEYRQALGLARAALRERLTGLERARAYELLGFSYAAMDSILRAVDAFKQLVLLDPERELDPNRVSPKAYSAFDVALRQVLLVRGLRVDSASFVGGQGAVPIRFTVTQPARVVVRAVSPAGIPCRPAITSWWWMRASGRTPSPRRRRSACATAAWTRWRTSRRCPGTATSPRPRSRRRAGGRWGSRSFTPGARSWGRWGSRAAAWGRVPSGNSRSWAGRRW